MEILNRVNARHIARKSALRTRTDRRPNIEKENAKIPRAEHDCGGIATEIEYDEQAGGRIRTHNCTGVIFKPYQNQTRAGIKWHLSRRNELGSAKDLRCPYFPFATLGRIGRHIYDKIPHQENMR